MASWAETMRFAIASSDTMKAAVTGDPVNCLIATGQGVGRIQDIPTVADVIKRTVVEAKAIVDSLKGKVGS
ncbi:hypothetical protein ACFLVW_02065 [Chloroflexota bacterium]